MKDDLNTEIIRVQGKPHTCEDGLVEIEEAFRAAGLPFRRVSLPHPEPSAGAEEVDVFFGRREDKQAFLDVVNVLLKKQKDRLSQPSEGPR